MNVFIGIRTLTAVAAVLGLCLVATVRAGLVLQRRTKICGVKNEGVAQRLWIAWLEVAVTLSLLALRLMVAVPQTLLEEDGDIVGDALQVLVALGLCCLETPCDMAAHKGHGHGVGSTGSMDGMGRLWWREDCLWGKDEGTWRLSSVAGVRHGMALPEADEAAYQSETG